MTDDCMVRLPGFWTDIANILWPGYYKPDVSIGKIQSVIVTLLVFCVHWYNILEIHGKQADPNLRFFKELF